MWNISLALTWSENCVLIDTIIHAAIAAQGDNPARPEIEAPTKLTLKMTDTVIFISSPIVIEDDNKILV